MSSLSQRAFRDDRILTSRLLLDQRAPTSSASNGRPSPSASALAFFTRSGSSSRVDAYRATLPGLISFPFYDYARRIGQLNESPGRLGTRVRGRRSICAGSVPADLSVLFPCVWGALARLPNRGKAIPRRPATQHSTLSLCIHISRLNVSCPTLISIPCVPRYRAHPCTTPRGTLPPSHGTTAVSHFAEVPSPPFHERTRWTSHARTSCYLSAPIQISHPITHCICCLSSCSHPHVFHRLFLHSLRYHDIVFARIRPSPVGS